MKKFFLLILTFAYLASSTGATIYIHQCMGKTIGWDVNIESGNSCDNCGMHKNLPKDCCNDQAKVLKTIIDQNLPATFHSSLAFANAILPHTDNAAVRPGFKNINNSPSEFFLLARSKINYCVLYCTFLI
jgi:hypothetical protein